MASDEVLLRRFSCLDTSLRKALKSPLFMALQNGGLLNDDHEGGCVLYEKRTQVEALLSKQT